VAKKQITASEKQLEVFVFIVQYVERHGYQPSQQEISNALGVARRAVFDRLKLLEEKGYLELSRDGRDRAIWLKHVRFEARFTKGDPDGTQHGLHQRANG
jgi:SOS-response transcriptional repressor LexA